MPSESFAQKNKLHVFNIRIHEIKTALMIIQYKSICTYILDVYENN